MALLATDTRSITSSDDKERIDSYPPNLPIYIASKMPVWIAIEMTAYVTHSK